MLCRSLVVVVALGGCALTNAIPVTDANPNPEGFRVNAVSTKFVSTPNGLVPVSYSDPCTQYAVQFWSVFSKNESTLTLNQNGTLTSIAVKHDSTEIPLKLIEFGTEALKLANPFPAASSGQSLRTVDSVQVFDIECGPRGTSRLVPASDSISLPHATDAVPAQPGDRNDGGGDGLGDNQSLGGGAQ